MKWKYILTFAPPILILDEVQTGHGTNDIRISFLVWINEGYMIEVAICLISLSIALGFSNFNGRM